MLPVLDETRCTGCGRCVGVCPTRCLEPVGAVVWLPRPLDCVRCGACELVCPAGAVRVPVSPPSSPASGGSG
jgi:NAD-dependent dihydropyrimidine dehydrogenase PreA subunit